MASSDIDDLVGQWKRGEAHGADSLNNTISRVAASRIQRSGGVPFQLQRNVCRSTVTNIRAAIANHHGVALANKASWKKTPGLILRDRIDECPV